ncbi:MAG: aminotransferase class I/II-fold pyridoxal phosphate-dependent enzyme, partial [Bacteroidota bacterium]
MSKQGFSTKAIHAGNVEFTPGSMITPLYQSVAYPYADAKEAAAIFTGEKPGYTYGRWDNPTVDLFERRMAALEGTDGAIATSSGMAAIFLLSHHWLSPGDEVVSSNRVYGGTFGLFETGLKKMGTRVNWVTNPEDINAWKDAITPKTKFLFVETPSNPALFIADIPALAKLAKSKKLPLVVDNTIATPALQQPIALGADVTVHSTTKYVCGNGTSLGGIICGPKELIDGIRQSCIRYLGPSMAPFNAWLNLLGLETLSLRMEKHCSNAMAVATFLEKHPRVKAVNYPGLKSNPYHKMIEPQMRGCSSLLSFELDGNYKDATKFIDSLKI